MSKVAAYYNQDPEREWRRLDTHVFEWATTMHHLKRYMSPGQTVLDLGGGPGRYALALNRLGHRVTLADLAEENLRFAQTKAEEQKTSLAGYVHVDARHLTPFGDGTFDTVLALGPLYHLLEEADRVQAIRECLRVLKPGGLLAVAFISTYGALYDAVVTDPASLQKWRPRLRLFMATGIHQAPVEGGTFTDAWFADPSEIGPWMGQFSLDPVCLIGAESMLAQSKYILYQQPSHILDEWIDFACETAESPAALAGSEHLVYFGRKR